LEPLISIIIPVYNGEKYLAETIDSVIKQTYTNWELLIVNDGSTDNTKKVIQSFLSSKGGSASGGKDNRVHYIFQKNAGVSAARNKGYQLSKGVFIAFLDADDLWLPDNLAQKSDYFSQKSSSALVHADMEVIDHNTKRTGIVYKGKEGNILKDLLLWNGCCIPAPSSILVKREVMETVGG